VEIFREFPVGALREFKEFREFREFSEKVVKFPNFVKLQKSFPFSVFRFPFFATFVAINIEIMLQAEHIKEIIRRLDTLGRCL
jgi:hypothetical protein